jgi:hypothetical protein
LPIRNSTVLPIVLLAYAGASLFHHVHNAEFLGEYPHMPAWLTRAGVYAAWLAATAVGAIGYWSGRRSLLIAYACYGLLSFAHYALAPVSAHTLAMNLSISLEAVTAAALLVVVLKRRTA